MDDKKKIAILATLFIVMIGVGAFQFVKGGSSEAPAPAPAPVAKAEPQEEKSLPVATKTHDVATQGNAKNGETNTQVGNEGAADAKNPANANAIGNKSPDGVALPGEVDPALVAAAKLNPRDPFDGRKWDRSLIKDNPQPAQSPPQVNPIRQPRSGISGGGFQPIPLGGNGALPTAENGQPLPPGAKMPSIDDFPYTVSGTLMGDHPCVVLTDSAGKQKLVSVGGSIDGDSKVLSISKGKVTVRHRGKIKTFSVGGITPSENKQEGN